MRIFIIIGLVLLSINISQAEPITTAFTYQGDLKKSEVSASGTYDFQFEIFALQTDGSSLANTVLKDDVVLEGGVFTVELDFGDLPFTGEQLWLEIGVRLGASEDSFAILTPRQKLNAVPYALHAEFVAMNSVGSEEVNPDEVQLRINSTCPENSSIRIIANDGSVTCETDDVGLTTVTSTEILDGTVAAIDVDTTSIQQRVSGTCPTDNYLVGVNADGSVICNVLPNIPFTPSGDRVLFVSPFPARTTAVDYNMFINGVYTIDQGDTVSVTWEGYEQNVIFSSMNSIGFTPTSSGPENIGIGGTIYFELKIGNRVIPFVDWNVAADGSVNYNPQALSPYTFEKPTITSVSAINDSFCINSPPEIVSCLLSGGNRQIEITGTSFGYSSGLLEVTINDRVCLNPIVIVPHTTIQCTMVDEPVGCFGCPVVVSVMGQASDEANLVYFTLPSAFDNSLFQVYCTDNFGANIPCEPPRDPLDPGYGNSTIIPAIALTESDTYQVRISFDLNDFPSNANTSLHNIIVKFGRGESFDELEYECYMFSFNTISPTSGEVVCIVNGFIAAFVGVQNVIGFSIDGIEHIYTGFTISTPVPSIIDSSIRLNQNDPIGNTSITMSDNNQKVFLDVDNIGGFPDLVSVFYGPTGGPYLNECRHANIERYPFYNPITGEYGPEENLTSVGTISCYMPASAIDQHFVVQVDNQTSVESDFTVSSPVTPELFSVSGCVDDGPETIDCPTSGFYYSSGDDAFFPQDLTITGQNFPIGLLPLIMVGNNICYDVRLNGLNELKCSMPPGTGRQGLNISFSDFFIRSDLNISYATPTIQSIQGCVNVGATTIECSRSGGNHITITGTNFGASGAQVIIGDNICTNAQHDPISPHTKVTCTLPAGSGMNRSVRLISSGSDISNVFFLSYWPF